MLIRSLRGTGGGKGKGIRMRRLPRGDRTFSLRFHFLRCGIIARVTNRNTQFRAGCSYNAIARSCFNNVGPANLSTGSYAHSHAHTHARGTRNMLYRRFNKSCNDSYWFRYHLVERYASYFTVKNLSVMINIFSFSHVLASTRDRIAILLNWRWGFYDIPWSYRAQIAYKLRIWRDDTS